MFGNRRNHFNYGYQGQMMQSIPSNFENNPGFIRNQPNLYQNPNPNQNPNQNLSLSPHPQQNYQWQPYLPQNTYYQGGYQPQNPYYQGGYQPLNQAVPQGNMQNQHPFTPPTYPNKDSQFLFQNPLQPQEEMYPSQYPQSNGYPNMNPYPKQNMMQKQPGGMQSFMNSFKSQDGSVDYNKMMNTAGQMMTAVNQVSSLVKGLGGIFKV